MPWVYLIGVVVETELNKDRVGIVWKSAACFTIELNKDWVGILWKSIACFTIELN